MEGQLCYEARLGSLNEVGGGLKFGGFRIYKWKDPLKWLDSKISFQIQGVTLTGSEQHLSKMIEDEKLQQWPDLNCSTSRTLLDVTTVALGKGELFSTRVALVRFLTSMNPHVPLAGVLEPKRFAADFAWVGLLLRVWGPPPTTRNEWLSRSDFLGWRQNFNFQWWHRCLLVSLRCGH